MTSYNKLSATQNKKTNKQESNLSFASHLEFVTFVERTPRQEMPFVEVKDRQGRDHLLSLRGHNKLTASIQKPLDLVEALNNRTLRDLWREATDDVHDKSVAPRRCWFLVQKHRRALRTSVELGHRVEWQRSNGLNKHIPKKSTTSNKTHH